MKINRWKEKNLSGLLTQRLLFLKRYYFFYIVNLSLKKKAKNPRQQSHSAEIKSKLDNYSNLMAIKVYFFERSESIH